MSDITSAPNPADLAATLLLIELAFLLPPGTDIGPDTAFGRALLAYRDAVQEAAIEEAP